MPFASTWQLLATHAKGMAESVAWAGSRGRNGLQYLLTGMLTVTPLLSAVDVPAAWKRRINCSASEPGL